MNKYQYPVNVIVDILGIGNLNEEQIGYIASNALNKEALRKGLATLSESERAVIEFRYKAKLTLKQTGEMLDISDSRVHQIEAKALRKMRHPKRISYLKMLYTTDQGLKQVFDKFLNLPDDSKILKILEIIFENHSPYLLIEKNKFIQSLIMTNSLDSFIYSLEDFEVETNYLSTDIEEMGLSVRAFKCLRIANIYTIGELINAIHRGDDLLKIRNLGVRSIKEILNKLVELGYRSEIPEELQSFI